MAAFIRHLGQLLYHYHYQLPTRPVCVIRYGNTRTGCVVKYNNELQRNTDQRLLFTFFCCIFVVKMEFVNHYLNH